MQKNLAVSNLLDFYGEILSEKQREATEFYYNDDLSLSEIAQNQNISKQGVRDIIKRAENQLMCMEKKLHLFEKFKEMNSKLETILTASTEIKNSGIKNKYVQDRANIIISMASSLSNEQIRSDTNGF